MDRLLDTSNLVRKERQRESAERTLMEARTSPHQQIAILAVTVAELAHGLSRALSAEQALRRQNFLGDLLLHVPALPVTSAIAFRAGHLQGELLQQRFTVALPDLLIGATALELGSSVLTDNVRPSRLIPDLTVESA